MDARFFILLIVLHASMCIENLSQTGVEDFQQAILQLRNNVLKVAEYQDFVNNNLTFKTVDLNSENLVKELSELLRFKFQDRINAVRQLYNAVKTSFDQHSWGKWMNCCHFDETSMNHHSSFKDKVDLQNLCTVAAASAVDTEKTPDSLFLRVAKENLKKYPGLKWQYFGSDSGVLTQYPASTFCASSYGSSQHDGGYDNRFRPWYVQASAPKPKDIVLVIDRSASMRKFDRMVSTQQAAVTVLNTLTPDDRVAVVAFSDQAYTLGTLASELAVSSKILNASSFTEPKNTSCFGHTMAAAIPSSIDHLIAMIQKIVPAGETYYTNALKIAFNLLLNAFERDKKHQADETDLEVARSRERVVLFLSDGEPSDAPRKIFQMIHDKNRQLLNSVVLLCFALGKSTFGSALQKMAKQDFNFQDGSPTSECEGSREHCDLPAPPPGMFQHVRETANLRSVMGFYYNFFFNHNKSPERPAIVWSVPYYDVGGVGMVITSASAVIVEGELAGVVGVDISLDELLADATFYRKAADVAFTFMLDLTGRVVMHPFMPNPLTVMAGPIITDFAAFERAKDVQDFVRSTLRSISAKRGPTGEVLQDDDVFRGNFTTTRLHPTAHKGILMYERRSGYACAAISSTNFVLCLVVESDISSMSVIDNQPLPQDFDFLYHNFRPESSQQLNLCNRDGQAVATDFSSVMFSPSAFKDGGKYAYTKETNPIIEAYQSYMHTGRYGGEVLFKDDIRDMVIASWPLERLWKESGESKSVVWRYFGSEHGVFRIYPGVEMPKFYDPVSRPWYETATSLLWEYLSDHITPTNKLTGMAGTAVSPPYLDANGAGLILTLSSAVLAPRGPLSAGRPHKVFGVLGADVSLIDFDRYLSTSFPECDKNTSWSCAAIDTAGYVISDERLVAGEELAVGLASTSNYHIIHAHSGIAHALIDSKILAHEKCVDISSASYKTTYHVNVSRISQVLRIPFKISHIPSTNIIVIAHDSRVPLSNSCVAHNTSTEPCTLLTTNDRSTPRCESPCVDPRAQTIHYSRCLNFYNYTWSGDPPPCQPVPMKSGFGFDNNKEDSSKIDVSRLPSCSVENLAEAVFQTPTSGQSLRLFITYVVGCCLFLLAVWAGLNRRRIRNYCTSFQS